MTEVIEGTAVEVESALIVQQPGNALVAKDGPAGMIAMATELATALADIVERQKLFAVIRGKKFPTVEAWMTIGRMDNVVAREAERPIRNDDGSYEGFVELVRLSDGMVIGRASALCGTKGDEPWTGRADPAKRAMAVTRATSRAFRQQYSWIMALAGYEATPSEELDDQAEAKPAPTGEAEAFLGNLGDQHGTIRKGDGIANQLESRDHPDGKTIGFKLELAKKDEATGEKKTIAQCLLVGQIGLGVFVATDGHPETLAGKKVTVRGQLYNVIPPGRTSFYRLMVTRIQWDEFTIPADEPTDAAA